MALLTDRKASSIKPGDVALADGTVPGLTLEPLATKGRGKWRFRFTSPETGKRRTMILGGYPSISIAEAREAAGKARTLILQGVDPIEAQSEKNNLPSTNSFEVAAKQLHAELLPGWKNKKHGEQWIGSLESYVFPFIGSMALNAIKPAHVAEVLRPIWLEIPETAGRVKQRIHAVMAWAWAHGVVESNPVDVVAMLLPKQPKKNERTAHHPAMPWGDVPAFVQNELIPGKAGSARNTLAFLILTACRSGEVRGMRWSEVDVDRKMWVIPAERMKMSSSHRIPLSVQAMQMLEKQRGLDDLLVFPSITGGEISVRTMTQILQRADAVSDTSGRPATPHGFRSSFRDWASENGYPRDMAERALAHAVANQVEAAYHRTDLLEQRRPMMQAWADFVMPQLQNTGDSPASG